MGCYIVVWCRMGAAFEVRHGLTQQDAWSLRESLIRGARANRFRWDFYPTVCRTMQGLGEVGRWPMG